MANYIPAFWYLSNNFGDAVTHFIIQQISGKTPVWVEPHNPVPKVMVTGSILNNEAVNATVWGAGLANANDPIPHHDIRAVRGRLTLARLKELRESESEGEPFDTTNILIGDPVMLLPYYYNPPVCKNYRLGIIPHYIDALLFHQKLLPTLSCLEVYGITIIDVNQPVEDFIKEVMSCERILSSSLHGIICADAYAIPAGRIVFSDNIGGDGFKFDDWFSNFEGRAGYVDARNTDFFDFTYLSSLYKNYDEPVWRTFLNIDLDELEEACPFLKPTIL